MVYGWSNNANDSCRAKKIGLPILNHIECMQNYRNSGYVTSDKGCIGVIGSISPVCKVISTM